CRGWTGTAAATTRNRRSCARSRSGGGARSGAMAVRQFDGVDDDIRHTVGSALADMAYGTFAALIKPQAPLDDYGTILSLVTSGNVLRVQWYYDATTSWSDLYVPSRTTAVDLPNYGNQWVLLVARKASGSVPVTYSLYRFNQVQWTHSSSSNFANWPSPGTNGQVRRSDSAGELHFRGLIAVQAVWANRVPFANNTAVQNAGLHQSLEAWFDAEPDALWAFNQESVTDLVNDLTGNGADQIARTGTAVVIGDDPPGFDWGDEDEEIDGAGTVVVPAVEAAGDGSVEVAGSGVVLAAAAVVAGTGSVVVAGSGAAALPAVAAAGAGTVQDLPVDGAGQIAVPAVTAEGVGAVESTGAGQVAVPAVTADGSVTVEATGAGRVDAPAVTADGIGTVEVSSAGTIEAPAVTAAGAGGVEIAAAGAAQVPAVRASGAGTVTSGITGSGAVTLPPVEASGVGTVEVAGSGTVGAAAVTAAGAGSVLVDGAGSVAVPAVAVSGVGTVDDITSTGSGSVTLPAVT